MQNLSIEEIRQILADNRWPSPDDPERDKLVRRNIALIQAGDKPAMLILVQPGGFRSSAVIHRIANDYYTLRVQPTRETPDYWEFTVGETTHGIIGVIDGEEIRGIVAFKKLQEVLASCEQINEDPSPVADKAAV